MSFVAHEDFNATYRAFDAENNKNVLIRILHPDLIQDNTFVKQFLFKADKLKYLAERFPGNLFLQNVRFGTADIDDKPRPYIVTDYIQGVTLAEVLEKQNRLSPNDAIEIIRKVAKAVNAAHNERIVIRDFSPTNVMLSLDESKNLVATLADIGVPFENLPSETIIQNRQGYYAPEEKHGNAVSEQSDIYGLAALLFRMLEGYDPSHRNGNPDTELTSLLKNALLENPSKPPSSVEQFLESISSLSTIKSNISTVRWSLIIPQMLKYRESLKVKLPGQKPISVHYEKKYADIPLVKPPKLPSSVVTGLVTAFFLWTGKKIESVLSSPKKAFKFFLIGLASIAAFIFVIWYFFFSPAKTTITVLTDPPGAMVSLNGSPIGKNTPLENYTLDDTGMVFVVVSLKDYFDDDSLFKIIKEQNNIISFPSLQPSGELTISVKPPEATVEVDSIPIPPSKLESIKLSVGQHKISVYHSSYIQKVNTSVEIEHGDSKTLNYDITKGGSANLGGLDFTSGPRGSKVYKLNNGRWEEIGKIPFECSLPIGDYKIKVELDADYVDYVKEGKIRGGEPEKIFVPLTKAGYLQITTYPNQEIDICRSNNKDIEKSGNMYKLKPGEHKIYFLTKGGYEWEETITIEEEKTFPLFVDFNQNFNIGIKAFDLNGEEKYAEVFFDYASKGSETPFFENLRTGLHYIKADLVDHKLSKIKVDGKLIYDPKRINISKPSKVELIFKKNK